MKMKRTLFTCVMALALVCACLFLLPNKAEAATVKKGTCGKNVTWVLDDQGTLTISGTGAMTEYTKSEDVPWSCFLMDIQKVVVKSGVTTLSAYACYCANDIEEISLPNTLTKIGKDAIFGCNLKSITIPEKVTSIGTGVFHSCFYLEKINVSASNTYYSSDSCGVLYNKQKTRLIRAPQQLIGTYTVPSTVKTIDAQAFQDCQKLKKVQGMAGVTTIGESGFRYCNSLESFSVPSGVTVLQDYVLNNCLNLRSLTIHEKVTSLGEEFMSGCPNLTTVSISSKNPVYCADSRGVVMDKKKTYILYAPGGITGTYTVPSTVKEIKSAAFANCGKVENVIIPEGVKSIEDFAFEFCFSLKKFHMPASVTGFGNGVLDDCTSLTKITVAKNNPYYSFARHIECMQYDNNLFRIPKFQLAAVIISYVINLEVVPSIILGIISPSGGSFNCITTPL